MASGSTGDLGRQLGRLFGAGGAVGLTDGELLERFAHRRDEAAEAGFETLLARHGAMVLTVCRQVLGDAHAAEDAFQATFLVLVRRAGSLSVRAPGSLGPWLYGVAYRIALKSRQGAARRRAREHRVAVTAVAGPSVAIEPCELRALLHDEVNRLPAKYRTPVVLCYFEGRTHEEAAAALRWPVGTVRGRLARARDRLRDRLTRRGLEPAEWIGAGVPLLKQVPRLEPPARLLEATVAATIGGTPAADVAVLASLMRRSLLMARLRMAAAAALTVTFLAAGAGLAVLGEGEGGPPQKDSAPAPAAGDRPPTRLIDPLTDPLPKHALARLGNVRFRHTTGVQKALYTPDGKQLVSTDGGGVVHIWDAATGRVVREIADPTTHVRDLALSSDGTTLATAESPSRLRLWDLATGRERRRWHGNKAEYGHLVYSADGQTLATTVSRFNETARKNETFISLWDTASPTERRRLLRADWLGVADVKFSPDGTMLATASNDSESYSVGANPEKGSTRLWDLATRRERFRFPVAGFRVRSIAFSPDGRLLAAGVTDHTIRLYDVATGRERTLRLEQDDALRLKQQAGAVVKGRRVNLAMAAMRCLAFSPDGSILAAGSGGTGNTGSTMLAEVYLWDVARGKVLRRLPAHQGWIGSLSFSPDGKTLATTGPEPTIRLWDVANGRELLAQPGHRGRIRTLAISPSDGTVFTAGQDGSIRRWDQASGRELGTFATFESAIDAMAFSPDGKTLLLGGSSGGLALWSVAERREVRRLPRIEERNPVRFAVFSPDGRTVASERRVWDAATGKVLGSFRDPDEQNNHFANFYPLFYSPDGQQIITAEPEGVRIWALASNEEVRRVVRAEGINYRSAALSPDGRFLARGGLTDPLDKTVDPAIRLVEISSGEEVAALKGSESGPHKLAFSPDGRLLVSAHGTYNSAADATVRVWDVSTGRELRRFVGHLAAVTAVAFSPDGRSVVSAGEDAIALVWDVADLTERETTARPIADDELRARWNDLASDEAPAAYRATWALSVPSAVAFLREHLQPAAHPDPKGIPAARGPIAPPEVLRTLRAMAALERVGSSQARAVLERMARGNLDAIETRNAKAALDRLNRRPVTRAGSSIR